MFDNKLTEVQLRGFCEMNQEEEALKNNTISYKFIFKHIVSSDSNRFKSEQIRPQPYSIFQTKDTAVTEPLKQFMDQLLG